MLQEFNVETMHNETFAKLLFVFMSTITTVFMLNLLIGLMSEYMSQVHEREVTTVLLLDIYPFVEIVFWPDLVTASFLNLVACRGMRTRLS